MSNLIIEREKLNLNTSQMRMVKSGWGKGAAEDTIVEKMTYISDGLNIKGYLAYQKNISKKYPCIIWCRGGMGNKGTTDEFYAQGIFGQIASWGYVVFASQYRGNEGSEGKDEFGGKDVNDVLNLIPLADEIPFANKDIWGIEGWSRGGMMTYLTLTRNHNFKAAITIGGIADMRCNAEESKFMRKLYEMTMGQVDTKEFHNICESRSIVNFADKLSPSTPILILHGTADTRVFPHDSLDLSYKLIENKIPFRLVMLEGGDHFLKSHRNEADRMRKEWFDKYLK